ncbi:NAD(P)H-dependent glycerol-3-phosphate dehydrogenase, partial [candidate division WOR-3 bacterium]|nr:NAD(P)H-dependent glycerol-3-phosphate dehydrogenase [candidate division WOR-3 bacterium]
MRIGFVGAGRWALALGTHLHSRGNEVALYEPSAPLLDRLLASRSHPDLPPACLIPRPVEVSPDPARVLAHSELVVFAAPSDRLAAAAKALAPLIPNAVKAVVSVVKGIDPETLRRMSVILHEALPRTAVVVLAGPGIPWNLAAGDPTSLVAASEHEAAAGLVRDAFTGGALRVYSHADVTGVELGAALKNVIAVAAGIGDGLGLGINARAALLTRGLAEITRLGLAFNCNPLTFAGLSGMGDLIVTTFSEHSRNHRLGLAVGRGTPVPDALAGLSGVAEGAVTAKSGLELGRRMSVELPITEEVFRTLYEGAKPAEGLERLLRRRPRKEVWQ